MRLLWLVATVVGMLCPAAVLACGGTFLEAKGIITNPRNLEEYPHSRECAYTILASEDARIKLSCSRINLQLSDGCLDESLSINGIHKCGNSKLEEVYGQGAITLRFSSNGKFNTKRGFRCIYERISGGVYDPTKARAVRDECITTAARNYNDGFQSAMAALRHSGCDCATVKQTKEWSGNFQANLIVKIPYDVNSWTITMTFSSVVTGFRVWAANPSATPSRTIRLTSKSYNSKQSAGYILTIDFIASFSGVKPRVTSITFNNTPLCLN